jgi:chromosome segregation ATPase
MNEHDIRYVLDLVKNNRLQTLQREAERRRSEINMLETEKTEAISQIFRLKRRIHESEETLAQKRKEMACLNRETRNLRQEIIDYNSHNLRPAHSEPHANSESTQIVPYNKERILAQT